MSSASGVEAGSLFAHNQQEQVEGEGGYHQGQEDAFAGVQDTWTVIKEKLYIMWLTYGKDERKEDTRASLTIPQIRTVVAFTIIPTFLFFLSFILCYVCCKRRNNRVPQYLTDRFPLYERGENSAENTPVLGRRRSCSCHHKLDNKQQTFASTDKTGTSGEQGQGEVVKLV